MLETARPTAVAQPIRAGTPERGWDTFVHFERQTAGGGAAALSWPLTAVAAPGSKAMMLDATATEVLEYALSPQAAAQVPVGLYEIVAAFEVPAALSAAFHNYGDVFGRRGARPARREEREYREYLSDEQRRGAGCIGGRMPP